VVAPPPILHPEGARTDLALTAVHATGLRKVYGAIEAVAGLDFDIHAGEVFGLLGPNGAGKTSTISMLATRLRPTAGDATVFGHSVSHAVHQVRALIGLVPQDIALYPRLTAAENLHFFGRAYGVPSAELGARIDQLLVLVGLDARRDDYVDTYSGGMKRRLNLAVGLVHHPRLLLLDEPTVGVDPHSREHIFQIVENLRAEGAAVLYTTHYMEEAERLCDRIGIMDEGKIIAMGTLQDLLAGAGSSEVIRIIGLPAGCDFSRVRALQQVRRVEQQEGMVRIFVNGAAQVLAPLAQVLGRHAEDVTVEIAPLSLESFFLQLTGKELRD
jgi:ABC-2 type transport system ATP-binding protein